MLIEKDAREMKLECTEILKELKRACKKLVFTTGILKSILIEGRND